MATTTQVLEELTAEDGTLYQLVYTPGSSAPWTLCVNGVLESSYDDYADARTAWDEATRDA